MEFREYRLDNGLEIVAECNPLAQSASFAFFVKTGARDETTELSGVSHFLEHMVFKGTPSRSAADVNRELDEMGSDANAYTSEESTVYYSTVLPEYQGPTVALLSDIMRPSLRDDDFATEKKVIIEEIYKYEDQPPFGAHEKCMAAYFGQHPLARNILGSVESVNALTPESMRSYFECRYSPGNIVLAAAGRVDFAELVKTVEQSCGHWERCETPRVTPATSGQSSFQVLHKENATQEYAVQIATGPAADDADRIAARVMATIVGDDSGSRMFWDLIETGCAEYAGMGTYEFQGTGIFMTYLCCGPEQLQTDLERLVSLQRDVEQDGVTEDELARAKSKICSHIVLGSERPSNRMFSVGSNWIQRGQYYTVKDIVEQYRAITRQDVAAILERYPLTVNTTLAVGPLTDVSAPV